MIFPRVLVVAFLVLAGFPWLGAAPAERWGEADGVFRRDPRWLGGDAALTVSLGDGRTLWLFGDSFVSLDQPPRRAGSVMVRNSVAIQSGDDPRTAGLTFAWGRDRDGKPASFFADRGGEWYWPGHGLRLAEGPLVIFLTRVALDSGNALGFRSSGYAVAVIEDPAAAPEAWRPRVVDAPEGAPALPATAVVREGDWVVALAIRLRGGAQAGALVRYPAAALARGDLSGAEWWAGEARGWRAARELGAAGPAWVLDDAGAEASVHWDAARGEYVHVASYGFGATEIGVRTARALTGPWSAVRMIFRPAESDAPRAFVYAAKAHPGLRGPVAGDLVITYVANSFDPAELFRPEGAELYWPRFVRWPGGGP